MQTPHILIVEDELVTRNTLKSIFEAEGYIVLEANNGLKNDLGTIAMARTSDPNSATAQFFVNVKDNPALNARGNADG